MNHTVYGDILYARYWLSKIEHADDKLTGDEFIMRKARQYGHQSKFYSIILDSIVHFIANHLFWNIVKTNVTPTGVQTTESLEHSLKIE